MNRLINIHCTNCNKSKSYPLGTSLKQVYADLMPNSDFNAIGARVNNRVKDLDFILVKPKQIEFVNYQDIDGFTIYRRSLQFLLYVATRELFPQVKLQIKNSISNGLYCELSGMGRPLSFDDTLKLKAHMQQLVKQSIPFVREGMLSTEAVNQLAMQGIEEKARLFEQKGSLFVQLYYLENYCNYFYGSLVPDTSYLKVFDLSLYEDGLLLQLPKVENTSEVYPNIKQAKLLGVFKEYNSWVDLLNVPNLNDLNDFIDNGKAGAAIKVSEALQEKKVAEIANEIANNERDIKVILVAGPSASGKTTFSKRLSVQLLVNGISPNIISLDDYFVDREQTPKDEDGNYDFEALEAVDIAYFNKQLNQLLNGERIELPRFNFHLGKQEKSGKHLKLEPGHVVIVEGIHGLNPNLIPSVPDDKVFKVFLSALTQISLDDHNYIPTSDNRMIRRMIRDSKYRGYSAAETIKRWPSVRRGEAKNIFPYQERADIMFNSALVYELAVLKKHAEPLLKAVPENCPEYSEADRLLTFLEYFRGIDDQEIPPTSLLREFLGGSSFHY